MEGGQRLQTTLGGDSEIFLELHLTRSRHERVETEEGKLANEKLSDKLGSILL